MFRRPFLLALALTAVAAVAAFLVFGRGGGDESTARETLVPFAVFRNVPLDTPRAAIEHQFGPALRSEPGGALDPGTTCLFYAAPADAAPATEYQLCFLKGKLHSKFAG